MADETTPTTPETETPSPSVTPEQPATEPLPAPGKGVCLDGIPLSKIEREAP